MKLDEIKRWRKESTAEEASVTFISRLDRLIEMADAAEAVVDAWQQFCNTHPKFDGGFEDHRAIYDMAGVIKHGEPYGKHAGPEPCTCGANEACSNCPQAV